MSMPHGKYVTINPKNPDATAQSDYGARICNHSDLVKQMDYRGSGLMWTGFLVHKDQADKPNHQLLAPILRPDPVPVSNPRPIYYPYDAGGSDND